MGQGHSEAFAPVPHRPVFIQAALNLRLRSHAVGKSTPRVGIGEITEHSVGAAAGSASKTRCWSVGIGHDALVIREKQKDRHPTCK